MSEYISLNGLTGHELEKAVSEVTEMATNTVGMMFFEECKVSSSNEALSSFVRALAPALKRHSSSLKMLLFRGDDTMQNIPVGSPFWKEFAEAILCCRKLDTLSFERSPLPFSHETDWLAQIAFPDRRGVSELTDESLILRELNISGTPLTDELVSLAVEAVRKTPNTLVRLTLTPPSFEDNTFKDRRVCIELREALFETRATSHFHGMGGFSGRVYGDQISDLCDPDNVTYGIFMVNRSRFDWSMMVKGVQEMPTQLQIHRQMASFPADVDLFMQVADKFEGDSANIGNPNWNRDDILRVSDILATRTNCTTLYFDDTPLESIALLKSYLLSGHLKKLSLDNCSLTAEKISPLGEILSDKDRCKLEDLGLRNNAIGDEGLATLSSAVQTGCSLNSLSVEECELTTQGVESFTKAMLSGGTPSLKIVSVGPDLQWLINDVSRIQEISELCQAGEHGSLDELEFDIDSNDHPKLLEDALNMVSTERCTPLVTFKPHARVQHVEKLVQSFASTLNSDVLCHVCLDGCGWLNSDGCDMVWDALKGKPKLESVQMSACGMKNSANMLECLKDPNCALRYVSIAENPLNERAGADLVQWATSISRPPSICFLDMSHIKGECETEKVWNAVVGNACMKGLHVRGIAPESYAKEAWTRFLRGDASSGLEAFTAHYCGNGYAPDPCSLLILANGLGGYARTIVGEPLSLPHILHSCHFESCGIREFCERYGIIEEGGDIEEMGDWRSGPVPIYAVTALSREHPFVLREIAGDYFDDDDGGGHFTSLQNVKASEAKKAFPLVESEDDIETAAAALAKLSVACPSDAEVNNPTDTLTSDPGMNVYQICTSILYGHADSFYVIAASIGAAARAILERPEKFPRAVLFMVHEGCGEDVSDPQQNEEERLRLLSLDDDELGQSLQECYRDYSPSCQSLCIRLQRPSRTILGSGDASGETGKMGYWVYEQARRIVATSGFGRWSTPKKKALVEMLRNQAKGPDCDPIKEMHWRTCSGPSKTNIKVQSSEKHEHWEFVIEWSDGSEHVVPLDKEWTFWHVKQLSDLVSNTGGQLTFDDYIDFFEKDGRR